MTQPTTDDLLAKALAARNAIAQDLAGIIPANQEPKDPKPPRESPVKVHVARLSKQVGQPLFVASEVAEACGVSVQAIRKYADKKVCGEGVAPSLKTYLGGGMKINLYTDSDIRALQEFISARFAVHSTKGAASE